MSGLSRRFRVVLLQFLELWATPTPPSRRLPRELVAAMRDVSDARERRDCRAIGQARQRLRQARHAGLSREVANMLAKQVANHTRSV